MSKENTEQFTGKYESEGRVGNILVKNFFKQILSLIPRDTQTALEVGCGAGYSTEKLSRAFPTISWQGSDVSQTLVSMAHNRVPHVTFKTESVYELSHENNSVDLILALEVFEHLENPHKALEELHRVTRKHVILSVPREPLWRILNMSRFKYLTDLGNTPGHLNHWSTRSFKKFANDKFNIKEYKTPVPWTILLLEKK